MQREVALKMGIEEFHDLTGLSHSYVGHEIGYGGHLYKRLCCESFALSQKVFERACNYLSTQHEIDVCKYMNTTPQPQAAEG